MFAFLTIRVWWWIAGGLAAALAVMLTMYTLRGVQLERARADLKVAEADVRQAKVTIAGYQDAARQCTAATKALEQAGAERQAKADDALARLRKEADRYQESNKRLALLTAGPTPSGAGCSQALTSIRRELRK